MMSETGSMRRFAANVSVVMLATVMSRVTGFFREMLIPTKFDIGIVADVYNVAFGFPDLMFSLLIGGAISAALVPVLSGNISKGGEREGWAAVSRFINITMALTVVVCVVGAIFADRMVILFAQGWNPADPEDIIKITMAARLTRVLFPSVGFLMLAGFANSVLYSYQRFTSAAFGPVLYNILCIASILFLSGNDPSDYYNVDRVVLGVMLSSFTYFIFQTAWAYKNIRGNYQFTFDLRHKGFIRLFKIAAPSLVSSSVIQINTMVSASFSTNFDAGSNTALRLADRTWQMPYGIIAQSFGIAMLPNLSGKYANKDLDGFGELLKSGLRYVLLLAIPVAFACVSLSDLIIRTLFMNTDRTTITGIAMTASVLTFYSCSLVTQSVNTILTRAFYACNETRIPMMTGISTIALNIFLSVIFYSQTAIGVSGMALAYSLSSAVPLIMLVLLLERKLPQIRLLSGFALFFIKSAFASLCMVFFLYYAGSLVPEGFLAGQFSAALKLRQAMLLLGNAMLGSLIYFLCLVLFGVTEATDLIKKVLRRA